MDKVLSREEAKELMGLIGLPLTCWGNLPLMKKKLAEARRRNHPDKGGCTATMARLNDLWSKAKSNLDAALKDPVLHQPKYGEEGWEQWWEEFNSNLDEDLLKCDETLLPSDDEPEEADEAEGPSHSQTSNFSTPPKKKQKTGPQPPDDVPSVLLEFVSHAVFGNKTYTCFIIYTTASKITDMQAHVCCKFHPVFWCTSTVDDGSGGAVMFCFTPGRHRVTAVLNWGKKICATSFVLVRAVLKAQACYQAMGEPPFTRQDASKEGGLHDYDFETEKAKPKEVDWLKLCEFAKVLGSTDPLLIMGMYLEFSNPPSTCQKCLTQTGGKSHWQQHPGHFENAKIFLQCKQQKNICTQAADQVAAMHRVRICTSNRKELLAFFFEKVFEKMAEQCGGPVEIATTLAGVAWLMELIPDCSDQVVSILEILVTNTPKKRYVHFVGPINSGKTTLAAGIIHLVQGASLNINVPPEKLPFELGCGIDKFAVLLEDVKGNSAEDPSLPHGCGFTNLDNMRDHLDGAVPVNLEKKHVNKVSQLWPPGIVTSNDYHVPKTVRTRFAKTIRFKHKPGLNNCLKKDPILVTKRVLQDPVTLLALLVWNEPVSAFMPNVQEQVVHWKTVFEAWISFSAFMNMRVNCQEGKGPLEGICVYDDDEDDSDDGNPSGPTQNTNDTGYSEGGSFTQ
ncbi:Large T antigen [Lyfec polyomavirus MAF12]|nr:Large T antigen [Lyfec polyomavirus MAF12]